MERWGDALFLRALGLDDDEKKRDLREREKESERGMVRIGVLGFRVKRKRRIEGGVFGFRVKREREIGFFLERCFRA